MFRPSDERLHEQTIMLEALRCHAHREKDDTIEAHGLLTRTQRSRRCS